MGFDIFNTVSAGIGITAFMTTVMAVFMFATAPNEKLARLMGYAMICYAFWGWFGFAYHLVDDLGIARELRLVSVLAQMFAQVIVARFVFQYLAQMRPLRKMETAVWYVVVVVNAVFIIVILSDAIFGTTLLAGSVGATGVARLAPEPGLLVIPLLIYHLLQAPLFLWTIGQRIIRERGSKRRISIILAVSMTSAVVMGATGYLTWYGITGGWLAMRGLAVPLFIVAAFYSIANYRLFNVRVAEGEFFVFILWGFVVYRTFLNDSLAEAAPDIVLLVGVIMFGWFFIRNIITEFEARLALEELSTKLEQKVEKRTHELVRSKEHTETVVEHLPVGLMEVLEDATLVRINDAAEKMLDVHTEDVLTKNVFLTPTFQHLFGKHLAPGVREVRITKHTPIDIELTITSLALEEGLGFIVILRDITERKTLERAKDDFVATAAHQLRTPLAAIKWTFELLKTADLGKDEREVLNRGVAGVSNMEHIAEELMVTARLREGVSNYTFADADLTDVINESVALVSPLAEKKHISLKVRMPDNLPIVPIDATHLLSAMQNLLDNAVKYTPEGGSVTVTAEHNTHHITVAVRDTGIGIRTEDQAHVFEKFFRTHDATEIATDGSGLGLSIVKSIIEAHGGTLSFTSTKNVGSTFTYTIPLSATSA